MSIRVYPIRMTRKQWHIGLYTTHMCGGSCSYILEKDRKKKRYKVVNVLEQECKRNNTIEKTIVPIHNFDIRDPQGIFGKLHQADNIVIPQNEFTMILNFPFSTKLKITVNEPLGKGFTLKEVLYAIKLSYQDIYMTEDATSSSHMYILIRECEKCCPSNIKKNIKLIKQYHDNDQRECSICKEVMVKDDNFVKLDECSHSFHKKCLYQWIDSKGKTCPLCRKCLYDCDDCDGSGYKTIYHEGVVPPVEYRGIERRLHTDGLYGIYDYYLEDLYIHGLKYDNIKHELFVSIQT